MAALRRIDERWDEAGCVGNRRPRGRFVVIAAALAVAGCSNQNFADPPAPAIPNSAQVSPDESALRLARATHQAGDQASAIQLYRKLSIGQSMTPDVSVEFGDVLLEAGYPDDAIDTYSGVAATSPARLGALLGLTRAYLSLGEAAKALDTATEAQARAPQDTRVLIDRGVALDTLGRHADAQQCYRAVLAVSPRHVPARNNLALSLALTGQFTEAVALMAPLVRSSTVTPKVRENMAVIYGLMGDSDRAAAMSRADLDESATQANLAYLASVRRPSP